MFSLGDIRKSKWYLSESRFHENCSPLDVNKHEKYVLFSIAMKLLFFQMFENHLLARILFLVDMTEMIVTAFDNYYSNVFQGFFLRQKTGQFCCIWQSEKDRSVSHDMTDIPFISMNAREFQ